MAIKTTVSFNDNPWTSEFDSPYGAAIFPTFNVLLIEPRDEVFSRLQYDLGQIGVGTYRAAHPEEVFRVHTRIPVHLTLANPRLPQSSIWLTSAKLRMLNPHASIWLYWVKPSSREYRWAQLSGIERIQPYDGSLHQLSDRLMTAVKSFGRGRAFPSRITEQRCVCDERNGLVPTSAGTIKATLNESA